MEKRICILYTGGTIGMVPSEKGYVPSSGAQLPRATTTTTALWCSTARIRWHTLRRQFRLCWKTCQSP